jgi:hypothetical protein
MSWFVIALGWPAVIVSFLLTLLAIARSSSKFAVTGALFALPFMLYLFATPRFRLVALAAFGSHLAAAYALRRRSRTVAFMLFLPFVCLAAFVAALVVNQWTR